MAQKPTRELKDVFCFTCGTTLFTNNHTKCVSCYNRFCFSCILTAKGESLCAVCLEQDAEELQKRGSSSQQQNHQNHQSHLHLHQHHQQDDQEYWDEYDEEDDHEHDQEEDDEAVFCPLCDDLLDDGQECFHCDFTVCHKHMVAYGQYYSCTECEREFLQEARSKGDQDLPRRHKPGNLFCEICKRTKPAVTRCFFCDFDVCVEHMTCYDGFYSCYMCEDEYNESLQQKALKERASNSKDRTSSQSIGASSSYDPNTPEPTAGPLRYCTICRRRTRHPVVKCEWCELNVCRPHMVVVEKTQCCAVCKADYDDELQSLPEAQRASAPRVDTSKCVWDVPPFALPLVQALHAAYQTHPNGVPEMDLKKTLGEKDTLAKVSTANQPINNYRYYYDLVAKLDLVEFVAGAPSVIRLTPKAIKMTGLSQ